MTRYQFVNIIQLWYFVLKWRECKCVAKASIGHSTYVNIKESADESWLTLASSYEIKSFIYSVRLKATAALTKGIYSEIRHMWFKTL